MACAYKTIMCDLWTKHIKSVSWDAKIKFSLDKILDWCFCVAPWNASWFLLFELWLPTTILLSITSHKSNTHVPLLLLSIFTQKKKLYFLLYNVGNCWQFVQTMLAWLLRCYKSSYWPWELIHIKNPSKGF